MAAATADPLPSAGYPTFSLSAPSRFDQGTFVGRALHFYDLTDVRTLFFTKERVDSATRLLDLYKAGNLPPGTSTKDLWEARKAREATLHPDTGEMLFPLFRFAAFGPVNVPLCAALIYPTSSMAFIAGAQFMNQSYNVCVNYANRNASSEMSTTQITQAYLAAVATSCSVALGLKKFSNKFSSKIKSPVGLGFFQALVPFTAVVTAGIINLLFIRGKELTEGISVVDEEGTVRGKSKEAGKDALFKCSLARIYWSIPPILLPPVIMSKLGQLPRLQKSPKLRFAAELLVLSTMIWIFVPPALGAFPQRDKMEVSKMEQEFHNLTLTNGQPVRALYYNKGL